MRQLCQVLGVPASGYYAWQSGQQRAAAGGSEGNAGLGNRLGKGLRGTPAPLWHPPAASRVAPERARRGPPAPAHSHAPPGACARSNPRHSPHARPTPRTACAAPPTGYLTNPSPAGPTRSGYPTARTCPWPMAPGPICVPSRTGAPSTRWAGTWGPPCRKGWSPRPYSGSFSPSRPPRTLSFTRTAVVPGRAASIATTPTVPCYTNTGPRVRRAAAVVPGRASATTTPYRVRPRSEAAGPASKRRCSNSVSGLFLPTWLTHRPVLPTILTAILTTACTPASVVRRRITLLNNFLIILP